MASVPLSTLLTPDQWAQLQKMSAGGYIPDGKGGYYYKSGSAQSVNPVTGESSDGPNTGVTYGHIMGDNNKAGTPYTVYNPDGSVQGDYTTSDPSFASFGTFAKNLAAVVAATYGAGELGAGSLGADTAASTAGGLDSANGVLNGAVMSGGTGADAATTAAASTAGGLDDANGVLNGAVMNGTDAGTTAATTAGTTAATSGGTTAATSGGSAATTAASTAAKTAATTGGFFTNPANVLAASSLASGLLGTAATLQAGKNLTNAANNATQTTKDIYNDTVARENPYVQYGNDSMTKLKSMMNTSPDGLLHNFDSNDFTMDPGYQAQLKYGTQALQNSQAAKDGVLSGGALKDLVGYNQDIAGQAYQSAYERYMANKAFNYGTLMDGVNTGLTAAGNLTSTSPSFASNIANNIISAGQSSAASLTGATNNLTGGITNAANAYLLKSLLDKYSSTGTNPLSVA